jgi:hypothetical protein
MQLVKYEFLSYLCFPFPGINKMMKRTGHIILILLLLFGTTGMTITRHYCGTTLVGTHVFSTPGKCCGDNCPYCHNEKISFKITDNFESSLAKPDLTASVKNLLDHQTLPVLLAFADNSISSHKISGGRLIKPPPADHFIAGNTSAFLQVFLF